MRKLLLTAFLLMMSMICQAQIILHGDEIKDPERLKNSKVYAGRVEHPDTIIIVKHNPVTIMPKYVFATKKQQEKYDRLTRNVKKVWPYAKIVKRIYKEMTDSIAHIEDEAAKKAFVKEMEKKLRGQFEGELTRWSVNQGKILIKLVDRETGSTTYEVIKELKGGVSAFFFQGVARLFGSSLKYEYDANEEDRMIEDIIVRIENGTL